MRIDFENHIDAMKPMALKMGCKYQEADDLVQETCLMAHRKQHLFDGRNARGWLRTVMYNIMINNYRRDQHRVQTVELDIKLVEGMFGEPEDQTKFGLSSEMMNSLKCLDKGYREVLMKRAEGYGYREIARDLGVPIGTVMSRLLRARKKMQDGLRAAA